MTLSVDDTTFLAPGDVLKIDSELVLVQQVVNGTTLTVQRFYDGTTTTTHAATTAINLAFDQRRCPVPSNDLGAFDSGTPTGGSATPTGPVSLVVDSIADDTSNTP